MFNNKGEITPPCGVPTSVGENPRPASKIPAFNQPATIRLAGKSPIVLSRCSWSMLSNAPARSASRIHTRLDLPRRALNKDSIASWQPRPGRNPYEQGGLPSEVPCSFRMKPGLFRAASLQTRRAPFRCTGLSNDLCRVRDGARVDPVMARLADDERLAPHSRHEHGPRGLARSRSPEFPEADDLVDCHRGAGLAELAFPFAEPSDQLLAGIEGRAGRGVTDDRPPVLPQDDPAESCYQVLPALAVLPGLEAGPRPVTGLDLGLVTGRHLGDGGAVLGAQRFQHGRLGVQLQ